MHRTTLQLWGKARRKALFPATIWRRRANAVKRLRIQTRRALPLRDNVIHYIYSSCATTILHTGGSWTQFLCIIQTESNLFASLLFFKLYYNLTSLFFSQEDFIRLLEWGWSTRLNRWRSIVMLVCYSRLKLALKNSPTRASTACWETFLAICFTALLTYF